MVNISARDLNQDASAAMLAALDGPVFITDRGRPRYVLMTIEAYEELMKPRRDLVDLLSMDGIDDETFEPTPLTVGLQVPDL